MYLLFILLFNESPLIRKGEIIESKVDIQPFLLPNKNIKTFIESNLWCTKTTPLFFKLIKGEGSFFVNLYFSVFGQNLKKLLFPTIFMISSQFMQRSFCQVIHTVCWDTGFNTKFDSWIVSLAVSLTLHPDKIDISTFFFD